MRLWTVRWPQLIRRLLRPEPREAARAGRGGPPMRLRAEDWRWPLLLGLLIAAIHFLLFPPLPRIASDFPAPGEIAEEEIRAPFSFRAPLLERDVEMRRLAKVLAEPPALRNLAARPEEEALDRLETWWRVVRVQRGQDQLPLADRVGMLALRFPAVPETDLERALTLEEPDSLAAAMRRAVRRAYQGGVVDMLPPGSYDRVWIVDTGTERKVEVASVVTQARLEERLVGLLRAQEVPDRDAVWSASLLRQFMTPNLVYDPTETRIRQDRARQTVPAEREFLRGERIVDRGERITEEVALFLDHLHGLLVQRGGSGEPGDRWPRVATRVLVLAFLLGLFGWVGQIHFPQLLLRTRHLVALSLILIFFLASAAFVLAQPELGPAAVPVALLALLSTVLFKDRIGYATTLLALFLLGVLPDTGGDALFAWMVPGVVTVGAVRRIQRRSQFYQTIGLLIVLAVVLFGIMRLIAGDEASDVVRPLLVGVFTPIVSVALALFLLPIVEPIVGVSSDLTLLELSDLNHPLLKRMALETQGTYHHSQVVSQLAEQAARAIGANALLARVGALFHDIGKMHKPEYYVENQHSGENKHDELSPSMSALVVASHVKHGIEMGRRFGLPQAVIDFIPEHHGTSVMEYFYHKALESHDNETVKVDDFRYPGPKPQSRETAILMICDAVEAATRSLAKPTPGRIKEVTKQIMDKRLLSGELDESGLTLRDLARIREAVIPLLTGIHHARIAYPGQKGRDRERDKEREREKETVGGGERGADA
jgi:putative nucleotidyltransferase with HDIG domain